MLRPALLAVAVFTCTLSYGSRAPTLTYEKDVLCVLLLSGVQKEDIDAATLRKLERHNVNIDDINNKKLQKECLGNQQSNITVSLIPNNQQQSNHTTGKEGANTSESQNVGSLADNHGLEKIFEYLKYMGEEEKTKSRNNIDYSNIEKGPLDTLLSNTSNSDNTQATKDEIPSTEIAQPSATRTTAFNIKKNKNTNMNTELESFISILRAKLGRTYDSIPHETTTAKTILDFPMSQKTNDVEYIKTIVEDILSKRQFKDVNNNTTDRQPSFNLNNTVCQPDAISDSQLQNKTLAPEKFIVKDCKPMNIYANAIARQATGKIICNVHMPVICTDNDKTICNTFELNQRKVVTQYADKPMIENILDELKKVSLRVKLLGNVNAIENLTKSVPLNHNDNTSNNYRAELNMNTENKRTLDNQSHIIKHNTQNKHVINDLDLMDIEYSKALKTVLETQSKMFEHIYNRQRNLIKKSNNNNEESKLRTLENQPNEDGINKQSNHIANILKSTYPTYQNKQNKYPITVGENKRTLDKYSVSLGNTLEPKLEDWSAQTIGQSSLFRYEPPKNDNDEEDKESKLTNALNSIQYDPSIEHQYKRTWFNKSLSGESFRPKIKENHEEVVFIPNEKKINRRNDPTKSIWSPYFDTLDDKFSSIRKIGQEIPKKLNIENEYKLQPIQQSTQTIIQELSYNKKKYRKKMNSLKNIAGGNAEEFETKEDKKTNSQKAHKARIDTSTDAGYKDDWLSQNQFNDSTKSQLLPQSVIRDIARSIKDIVLRDLRYTTTSPMTIVSTTLTPTITKTTPSTTILTINSSTKETTFTTTTMEAPKIQDDSKAFKKMMELFEKYTLKKEKDIQLETRKHTNDDAVSQITSRHNGKTDSINAPHDKHLQPGYDTHAIQSNPDNLTPYDPQAKESNLQNPIIYVSPEKPIPNISLSEQIKAKNHGTYDTHPLPWNQKNKAPYVQQAEQQKEESPFLNDRQFLQSQPGKQEPNEKGTTYDPQSEQLKAENRGRYDRQPTQWNPENNAPYIQQAEQQTESRLQNDPQFLHSKSVNRAPYVQEPLQLTEKRIPYIPQSIQMKPDNRGTFDKQPLPWKPDSKAPYVQQAEQQKEESPFPNDRQFLQSQPGKQEPNEKRTPYDPQSEQLKAENHGRYDRQPTQWNPENNAPYIQQVEQQTESRLQNDPQFLHSKSVNRASYVQQPLQLTEKRTPYIPQSIQMKAVNRGTFDKQPLPWKPDSKAPYVQQAEQQKEESPFPNDRQFLQSQPGKQEPNEKRTPYDPQSEQLKAENHGIYDRQPTQWNPENNAPYIQQVEQQTESRLQNDPQFLHSKSVNRASYVQQPLQLTEKRTPYIPQSVQMKAENRGTFDTQPLPWNKENKAPYVQQAEQQKEETPFQNDRQFLQSQPENRETNGQQPLQLTEKRTPYNPQSEQPKAENRGTYDTQPSPWNTENKAQYIQQAEQKIETRLQNDPQVLHSMSVNRAPYFQQPLQLTEKRTPYISQSIQMKADNRGTFDTQPLPWKPDSKPPYVQQAEQQKEASPFPNDRQFMQSKPENRATYVQQPLQLTEKRTPYIPQSVQMKAENRGTYDTQPLPWNPENKAPYIQQDSPSPNDLQFMQSKPENREPYVQQLKAENLSPYHHQPQSLPFRENRNRYQPFDSQPIQNNIEEISVPYHPQKHKYMPEVEQPLTQNRMEYPSPLQPKIEYQLPCNLQRAEIDIENRSPYRSQPHTYATQAKNRDLYVPQVAKQTTEDRLPYGYPPLHGNTKPRPNDYNTKDPYRHSIYDTYLPEVIQTPHKKAITVQTNSGEISPLKIFMNKPFLQNVVLTTQPPTTVDEADDIYDFRKPKSQKKEFKLNENQYKEYRSRPPRKDVVKPVPKLRKIKKGGPEIERFHEKLERGELMPREEVKIAKRIQRPIVKNTNYDDIHFQKFLQTQQKVNAMLESILASAKSRPTSTEH